MADRDNGWYRITGPEWIPVTDEAAEAEIAAGEGWDLVHVETTTVEETLF